MQFFSLIERLCDHRVSFVIIGGVAAALHGSARMTQDIDVLYERTDENIKRLAAALAPLSPYLRDAPPGLPFIFDERTMQDVFNLTLSTSEGAIDLLAEVPGVDSFQQIAARALKLKINGREIPLVQLGDLIALKKAAGRPKDLEAIAELELLQGLQDHNKK